MASRCDFIANTIIEATGGTSQSDDTDELTNSEYESEKQTAVETGEVAEITTSEPEDNQEKEAETVPEEVNENVEEDNQEN